MIKVIQIHRDEYGIPHIDASSENDAWFAMGYASAEDRLWQMEWYRRRGTGRWAEIVGVSGLEADKLFRRFGLDTASQNDAEALTSETLDMFQSYADGVNNYAQNHSLPPEYLLTDTAWEKWEVWHSILVFKVRHVIMGKQLPKIGRLELLNRLGAEKMALLDGEPAGRTVILPPGGIGKEALSLGRTEFESALEGLGTLSIEEGGSNSWAVHGSRMVSGKPIICNDSHRPLDVPNVYWQCHVICPEFNVAGAAFPGVPGYPHFGFNGSVAWNITHGSADYTDLWVEEFKQSGKELLYRTGNNWTPAQIDRITIKVKNASDYEFELVSTSRGNIIHGQPRLGAAIAMRYTATDQVNRQWECLRPMLVATSVSELNQSQELWDEPVNNLVSADTAGDISYLYRGRIPVRSDPSGRVIPAIGAHDGGIWIDDVPRDELPKETNPPEGFIATSNQSPWEKVDPFLSHEFSPASRAERLSEILSQDKQWSSDEVITIQSDTTSVPAKRWSEQIGVLNDLEGFSKDAQTLLTDWDGNLAKDSPQGFLYSCFREKMIEAVYRPLLGEETWNWIHLPANASVKAIIARWFYGLGITMTSQTYVKTPDGREMNTLITGALHAAWHQAIEIAGEKIDNWRWGLHHRTVAVHTLSGFVDTDLLLDPPFAEMGGDGDTVQVSSTAPETVASVSFPVSSLSVYRQGVDFSKPDDGQWIIPGGISGIPENQHYSDQLPLWAEHKLIPMHHSLDAARAASRHSYTISH